MRGRPADPRALSRSLSKPTHGQARPWVGQAGDSRLCSFRLQTLLVRTPDFTRSDSRLLLVRTPDFTRSDSRLCLFRPLAGVARRPGLGGLGGRGVSVVPPVQAQAAQQCRTAGRLPPARETHSSPLPSGEWGGREREGRWGREKSRGREADDRGPAIKCHSESMGGDPAIKCHSMAGDPAIKCHSTAGDPAIKCHSMAGPAFDGRRSCHQMIFDRRLPCHSDIKE